MFCIRKKLYSDKNNIKLHLKLFNTCVKPNFLYCSKIWALPLLLKRNDMEEFECNYDKFVPNRIQLKMSEYVQGVHKSGSNLAVLGDLGLFPLSIIAIKSSIEFGYMF